MKPFWSTPTVIFSKLFSKNFYLKIENKNIKAMPLKSEKSVLALNQYYSRALMYEFSLNNRESTFVNNLADVI